jgi:hypothetical protein
MRVGVECGLILQGRSISVELLMAIFQHQSQPRPKRHIERPKRHIELLIPIFQHQSQPRPKRHSKGNAVKNPHLIHLTMPRLKVADVDDEESRQTPSAHPIIDR